MSNVPAGWYPSPEDPAQVRYWDGAQWTPHTAPAVIPDPTPEAAPIPTSIASPPTYAPPAPAGAPLIPQASPVTAGATGSSRKWLIGGAIAAGVIVVGSGGSAIGAAGNRPDAAPAQSAPPAVVETTPDTAPVDAAQPPASAPPVVEEADAVAFRAQANSHLDDMLKDLDDLVTTVEEDGFWRLLSNNAELAFNQGQLEALDVPTNVTETWPAALVSQQVTLDALTDAVGTQDGPSILAAIEVVRAQVEASRGVVETAQ